VRRAIPFIALILLAAFVLSGFSSQEIVSGRRRSSAAGATVTLVAHAASPCVITGCSGATSNQVDTTNATALVACMVSGTNPPTAPTDSKSNSWGTNFYSALIIGTTYVGCYIVYSPTTSSTHTFTAPGGSTGAYWAWKGTKTSSGVDSGTFAVNHFAASLTCLPGSVTPSQSGEGLMTVVTFNTQGTTYTIDSGFRSPGDVATAFSPYVNSSELTDSSSSAVNLTWTGNASQNLGCSIVGVEHP